MPESQIDYNTATHPGLRSRRSIATAETPSIGPLTLTEASAIIDSADRQQGRPQAAAAVEPENPVSNSFETVVREIGKQERRYSFQCLQNAWYDCFFVHRDQIGKDDISALNVKRSLGDVEDELTIFLQTSDGSGSSSEANKVKWYCEGSTSLDVDRGVGEAGTRQTAWVDDRNSPHLTGKGSVRLCGKLLTATELLRYLKQPV